MLAPLRKATEKTSVKWTLGTVGTAIAGYGIYAFIKRGLARYMFLKTEKGRLDSKRPWDN